MTRLAALVVLAIAGCGYHLPGAVGVPEGSHTIHVQLFSNHTREPGVDVRLLRAVEDEFRRYGVLKVVSRDDADLVLSGAIRSVYSLPIASNATDSALQLLTIMRVSLRLVERATGRVVFQNRTLVRGQDYGALGSVVITSSPRFQEHTINARDLAQMTSVAIGESRRREALNDLIEQIAHDIYSQTMEDF
jgi:Lipopolysaccharide-assembly